VYHLELRQFPRRVQRFNLDGPAVGEIVLPWVQERVVELGEHKWSPHQATLTILEGPELPLERVSMGRGWRAAERECEDVTDRVLAEARQAIAGGAQSAVPPGGADSGADPLTVGVELAALLGSEPSRLLAAWRAVAARSGGLAPSETLALAERELAERSSGG
jgi:hypothetical protein